MKTKRVTSNKKKRRRRTGVTTTDSVVLPEEFSVPSDNMGDYSFIFMGERGIGKTTTASCFDNPLFFMFEPGATSLRIKRIPRDVDKYVLTWPKFLEALDMVEARLEKDPDFCRTIVIDTGYLAYERCFEYILDTHDLGDPRDKAWGVGWKLIDKEFRDLHFRIFHQMGLGLVVITHTEVKDIIQKVGNQSIKIGEKLRMQLGSQADRLYKAIMDVQGYVSSDHMMRIKENELVEAKNRIKGHFLYTDGTPIEEFSLGESEEEAYQNIVTAFNNKLRKEDTEGRTKVKRKSKR